MTKPPLWVWWIVLAWAISLPWAGFTREPQWTRVHWLPFTDPADRARDFVLNLFFFVPFGYSFARRRPAAYAPLVAAAVSVSAEATQLFGTVRYPSATDVTAAVLGAAIGAFLARRAQPFTDVPTSKSP